MGDIVLEGNPVPPAGFTNLIYLLGDGNFFFMFPLPAGSYDEPNVWRIGGGVLSGDLPRTPSAEYLQNLMDTEGPTVIPSSALLKYQPLKITKVLWSTRFRTDSAIADKYITRLTRTSTNGQITGGLVILIGDAAHKQPLTGGQGMNLGLRDAVFLGPALAQHITNSIVAQSEAERKEADEQLIKWSHQRHAQALTVIALANRTLSIFSIRRGIRWYFGIIPVNWAWVRSWTIWFFVVTGISRRVTPWRLSGLYNR
jgi:2-polyprenyl-6-methoxyphenol hydroxylase-like FAD-dependent oxidoreductase